MIEILLLVNLCLVILWCALVLALRLPKASLLVAAFHFVLFIAKPLAAEYIDAIPKLIDFNQHRDAYVTYLACGFVFIAAAGLSYFSAEILGDGKNSMTFSNDEAKSSSLSIAIITFSCLILLTIVANISRFGDYFYFLHAQSSFDALLANSNSWYLNVIIESSLIAVGIVAVKSKNLVRRFLIMVSLLLVVLFFAKLSTRTGIIAMIIAILIESFSGRKIGVIRLLSIVLVLMGFYVYLSFLRLGANVSFTNSALIEMVGLFFVGFAPADLAVMLFTMLPPFDFLWFKYLGGAITPLIVLPSALVPFDKPRADLEAYVTGQYFGPIVDVNLFTEGSTLTFTAPASAYLNLGFFSVIIMGLLYGLLLMLATRLARASNASFRVIGIYWLIALCAGYRYSVEGAIVSSYSLAVLVLLYFVVEWLVLQISTLLADHKKMVSVRE